MNKPLSTDRKTYRAGLRHLCAAAMLCMSTLSGQAISAPLPIYIVSALPLGSTRNIVQSFIINQDGCDFVELRFAPDGTTKDNYRCHLLSGSQALLAGRGKFTISLDTPAGVEIHQFVLFEQDVESVGAPPAETRFSFASFLRVMPSQLPLIRQLSPGSNPSPILDPAEAALPPPAADSLLHIQLKGTDCTIQYGQRPNTLCALTRWGPQEIGTRRFEAVWVAVSGKYLQQPYNMVQIQLSPITFDPGHWSYTPTHFPPYSPLLLAVWRGDVAAARTLLGQGVDPNAHPPGLDAPLALAVQMRKLDIANLLVDHDADVNVQDSSFGFVLEMAAGYGADADRAGWFTFTKKLIAHGADVNRPGPYGFTPLMAAADARVPDPDMVELLLGSGANVNATATMPVGALLGLKMPVTAYDLAQAKLDMFNRKKTGWGGNPDLGPQLQKVMSILAQHGAKSLPR